MEYDRERLLIRKMLPVVIVCVTSQLCILILAVAFMGGL
jgi:hypothetical protein